MKSIQFFFFTFFITLITVVLLVVFTVFTPQQVSLQHEGPPSVVIPRGAGVREIGTLLHEKGIISRVDLFVLAARFLGSDSDLQAGRYLFPQKNSISSVLDRLQQGIVDVVWVTIPEGLTIEETAHRLSVSALIDSQEFSRLASDEDFINSLNIKADDLEGYLFPNTYRIDWEAESADVISMMIHTFRMTVGDDFDERAKRIGFPTGDVITLASIIEREVKVPEERALISAVFHNRLKLNRALESCATVEFALGEHKARLTEADLKVPSPYNTYLHAGLPPGPICSPGREAIEAALEPADVDYLYFVSRGDGHHVFSRSLEEHARAKNRIKRQRNNGR